MLRSIVKARFPFSPTRSKVGAIALVAAFCLAGYPATAQAQETDVQAIEKKLEADTEAAKKLREKSAALEKETAKLRAALVAGAKKTQKTEAEVQKLESSLSQLADKEKALTTDLDSRKIALRQAILGLERLSRRPLAAIFFSDSPPIDEARTGLVLSIAGKKLRARAQSLADDLHALAAVKSDIASQRLDLDQAMAQLGEENERLNALLAEKSSLQRQTTKESEKTQRRVEALAQQARDLKELLQKLADEEAKEEKKAAAEKLAKQKEEKKAAAVASSPPDDSAKNASSASGEEDKEPPALSADKAQSASLTSRSFPGKGGKIISPVQGKIAIAFGSPTEETEKSTGIYLDTRPGAKVVAPFDGKVAFQGPFRNYGQILIIEHNNGYHSILAGLKKTNVAVGQRLMAGEPVGIMAGNAALAEGSKNKSDRLYFELRRNGKPIDPAPWLDADGKARAAADSEGN